MGLEIQQKNLDTVVYMREGEIYERSRAAIEILRDLGFPWNFTVIFLIIPGGIRDMFYNLFAAYRYRIFGKQESCRVPSPEEKSRFLP